MRRATPALLAAAVAVAAPAAAAAPDVARSGHPYAVAELRASALGSQAVRAAGARVLSPGLRLVRVPTSRVRELARGGLLVAAEPDLPRVPFAQPADEPLFGHQWWYGRVGADRAEPTPARVALTIVDSGLDLAHPEFAQRPDTLALNPQTVEDEDEFHGTAVASVAAAPANGIGLVGAYDRAALRSWDASPSGRVSTSTVIAGLEAAARLGRGVANLSLGGSRSQLEANAVAAAFARGVIVVAASGNEGLEGSPLSYPASLPHVLTVGASTTADAVARFSSRSPALDLVAPGEAIPIAVPPAFEESGFAEADGTSFAAPIVAGALAWVWSARPELEQTQVLEVLRRSARDLGPPGRDPASGFGLLDIPAALAAPAPPPDPGEPNETLDHVQPGGLLPGGKPALTAPGRGSARLSARLDVADDPRDVYRVWVPAGSRVDAVVRGPANVETTVLRRPAAVRLERSGTSSRAERLRLANRGRTGTFAYVSVFLRLGAAAPTADYALSLTTARAPR